MISYAAPPNVAIALGMTAAVARLVCKRDGPPARCGHAAVNLELIMQPPKSIRGRP
jgi:hypothetical protein